MAYFRRGINTDTFEVAVGNDVVGKTIRQSACRSDFSPEAGSVLSK